MMLGIDYAGVDGGHIDPAKTGARFAYVRASGSLTTDPTWARDRPRWAAVGIPAGAYHWFNFHADPVAQARTFIAAAGMRARGEMPPALDLEADSAAALGMTPHACAHAAETCLHELVQHYGTVVIYTSARVWSDVFGGLQSPQMGACPLWLKVPYAWKARNPPKLDSAPATYQTPTPWRAASSAGAWMMQFQGDAVGLPGTTSTVDLNKFLPRSTWASPVDVRRFQHTNGLAPDGIIGPQTFAALTHP